MPGEQVAGVQETGVSVGVLVAVGVLVGVAVSVGVGVLVGVAVGVAVEVGVAVGVGTATQRRRPVRSCGPHVPEQQSPCLRHTSPPLRHVSAASPRPPPQPITPRIPAPAAPTRARKTVRRDAEPPSAFANSSNRFPSTDAPLRLRGPAHRHDRRPGTQPRDDERLDRVKSPPLSQEEAYLVNMYSCSMYEM